MSAEFDKLANSYEDWHSQLIKGSGYGREYFLEYKVKEVCRVLGKQGFKPGTILDFGCGVGGVDPYIQKYFPEARLFGTDISQSSVEAARAKLPGVTYGTLGDDYSTAQFGVTFDLVFISNVFHHAPPGEHRAMLSAIKSQMSQNARLFIFEINPYNPATRHVFAKYEKPIDKNANMVSSRYMNKLLRSVGFSASRNIYTVFFPKALSFFLPLEKYISWLPLGAHYYIRCENR